MVWFGGDSDEVAALKERISVLETDKVHHLNAQARVLKGDINAMKPEEGWFSGGGKRTKKRTKKRIKKRTKKRIKKKRTKRRRTTKKRTNKRTRRRR